MSPWFRPEKAPAAPDLHPPPPPPHLPLRKPSASRSRSGTPSLFGLGISWWTIVQFAGITLWISASSAKLIKLVLLARSAQLLGVFATMLFISTVLADGSRHVRFAHWITVSGSSKSMVIRPWAIDSWVSLSAGTIVGKKI